MIVITGASDGLGLQVAKLYAETGKTVVNISRRECQYATINICTSLQSEDGVTEAVQEILALEEPLEALINCVGVYTREAYGAVTQGEIERTLSTNVTSLLLLISKLMQRIEKDETDILTVTSSASRKGCVKEPVYSASKWAARGITAGLKERFKDTSNRVIDFCPGGMDTDFFDKADVSYGSTSKFMDPASVALALKQTLDLPKNIEVSEIVLNRK